MNTNMNIFEDSWKEFSAQLQKQRKIWSQMTDQYFDHLNNSRKEMMSGFYKQCDAAHEKTEQVLKETNHTVKKAQKETAKKIDNDIIIGDWKNLMDDVHKQWNKLTNDNLVQINGSREKLAGAIQKNYGIARAEAEAQMNDWEKTRSKILKAATN